jgi:hypothetical protein
MTWETYHAATIRQLPRGSEINKAKQGVEITFQCKHGHSETVSFGGLMPAQGVKKAMKNRGWKFYGGKCTCPAHADNRVRGEEMTQIAEAMKAAQAAAEKAPEPPKPSLSAKEARREAMRWLDDSFDLTKGCYKDDMSDAKVAELTGLSAKAVADLRAEFGYDIRVDPELQAIRDELAAIRRAIVQFKNEAATAVTALVERETALGERLTKWESRQ